MPVDAIATSTKVTIERALTRTTNPGLMGWENTAWVVDHQAQPMVPSSGGRFGWKRDGLEWALDFLCMARANVPVFIRATIASDLAGSRKQHE
jgi:hypothetical protein